MPKRAKELQPIEVKNLRHPTGKGRPAMFAVGGVSGLHLQVTTGDGRSWVLRTNVAGRRAELGLGPYPEVSLGDARDKAREIKAKVRDGIDPREEKRKRREAILEAQRKAITFANAWREYRSNKLGHLSPKTVANWDRAMAKYALPIIGNIAVQSIQMEDVERVLTQQTENTRRGERGKLWEVTPVSARDTRSFIESILDWAAVRKYRDQTIPNPARWKGNLEEVMPAQRKAEARPAVQIKDAPRWYSEVQQRRGNGSKALQFLALTAVRIGEVRGARWSEIDFEDGVWTIPSERMKMDREHRVPLSTEALALLKEMPRINELVFPAPLGGELSDATIGSLMKAIHTDDIDKGGSGFTDRRTGQRCVPHGLRSSFRDWAAEMTNYEGEMAETALAHKIQSKVEAAYRRGDMLEKRRAMMDAWAAYLRGEKIG